MDQGRELTASLRVEGDATGLGVFGPRLQGFYPLRRLNLDFVQIVISSPGKLREPPFSSYWDVREAKSRIAHAAESPPKPLAPLPGCPDRGGRAAEPGRDVFLPLQRSVAGCRDPFDAPLNSVAHPQRVRKALNGALGDETRAVDDTARALAAEDDAIDDFVNAANADDRSVERKVHSSM